MVITRLRLYKFLFYLSSKSESMTQPGTLFTHEPKVRTLSMYFPSSTVSYNSIIVCLVAISGTLLLTVILMFIFPYNITVDTLQLVISEVYFLDF
ncbi:hypothetical protein K439DRAFT_821196 [Ramaria rubella]|nr:hypothetical protein K439DRAFT_821196 [Ramaria rubella]